MIVALEVRPGPSYAITPIEWLPSARLLEVWKVHGAAVSVPDSAPSIRSSTLTTATSSLAVALTEKPGCTVASFDGESIEIDGGWLAGGGVLSSIAPFGVPTPVGPSQPAPARHRMLPHEPLVPLVTS